MRYKYEEMVCQNHKMVVVYMFMTNGHKRLKKQCFTCGKYDSMALKHTPENVKNAVEYSERLNNIFIYNQQEHKKKHFWEWYKDYLNSQEWKNKRLLVLKRDNFSCCRCGQQATEVHHNEYKNVGDEHLDDLASLCKECHDVIHWLVKIVKKSKNFKIANDYVNEAFYKKEITKSFYEKSIYLLLLSYEIT